MSELLRRLKTGGSEIRTDNGDVAYNTTYNYNLDLFASSSDNLVNEFRSAYAEDKILALKNLLFLRDIKGGKGRRQATRTLLVELAHTDLNAFKTILPIIPELGRWDDVLNIYPSVSGKAQKSIMSLVEGQLGLDIVANNKGESISLLAKWMPTIQSKCKATSSLAYSFAKNLGLTPRQYRKLISGLRKRYDLIETRLSNKDWTFDYSFLPQGALKKYINTFRKNDSMRYEAFRELIAKNKVEAKTSNYYPHELIQMFEKDSRMADALWKQLPKNLIDGNILVMRDGSGSMTTTWYNAFSPLQVADALSIYTSERLTGPFKDTFMTFSERPQMVVFPNDEMSLEAKVRFLHRYTEIANTDIGKAFKLILDSSKGLSEDEQLDTLLVISDMQFDSCVKGKSNYTHMVEEFKKAGVKVPNVVFWNVAQKTVGFPVNHTQLEGVRLIGGFSKALLEGVCKNVSATEHMMNTLAKYDKYFENKAD